MLFTNVCSDIIEHLRITFEYPKNIVNQPNISAFVFIYAFIIAVVSPTIMFAVSDTNIPGRI